MSKAHGTLNEFAYFVQKLKKVNITITGAVAISRSFFFFRSVSLDFSISLKNPNTLIIASAWRYPVLSVNRSITLSLLPDLTTTGYDDTTSVNPYDCGIIKSWYTTFLERWYREYCLCVSACISHWQRATNTRSQRDIEHSHGSLICFRRSGNRGRGRVQDRSRPSMTLANTVGILHLRCISHMTRSSLVSRLLPTKMRRIWQGPPWLFTRFVELAYERWRTGGTAE